MSLNSVDPEMLPEALALVVFIAGMQKYFNIGKYFGINS